MPSIIGVSCFAQNTAELRGSVVDNAGKPVVSAFVVAQSEGASVLQAATTDDFGVIQFSAPPVGTYQLQLKADGFRTVSMDGVRISIGQVLNLPTKMQLGQGTVESAANSSSALVDAFLSSIAPRRWS